MNGMPLKTVNASYNSARLNLNGQNGNDAVRIQAKNTEGVSPQTEFRLAGTKFV